MLGGGDPAQQAFYAKHLLAASIMAAPATLVVAKLLIPETGTPLTRGTVKMEVEKTSSNIIDAAAAGAGDGLRLALNIGAMLLAFIALIALINWPLAWIGTYQWSSMAPTLKWMLSLAAVAVAIYVALRAARKSGRGASTASAARFPAMPMVLAAFAVVGAMLLLSLLHSQSGFTINGNLGAYLGHPVALSLQTIFGYVLAPLAWVIGVPWQDATTVGSLIGQKIVINEFVAYLQLADIVNGKVAGVSLSDEGKLIATYALCGFANFSSIAIQIGGIGGLAPERRSDLARFGLRAVLGGTIATLMTATIAGVLSHFG
jgi:CNT family concentrative nucleoside transporter